MASIRHLWSNRGALFESLFELWLGHDYNTNLAQLQNCRSSSVCSFVGLWIHLPQVFSSIFSWLTLFPIAPLLTVAFQRIGPRFLAWTIALDLIVLLGILKRLFRSYLKLVVSWLTAIEFATCFAFLVASVIQYRGIHEIIFMIGPCVTLLLHWTCVFGVDGLQKLHSQHGHRTRSSKLDAWFRDFRSAQYHGLVQREGCQNTEGYIYYPESSTPKTEIQGDGVEGSSPSLFLPCRCCLNLKAIKIPRGTKEYGELGDATLAPRFLRLRKLRQQTTAQEFPNSLIHTLCPRCDWVVSCSRVLEARKWARRFRLSVRERELFEHHDDAHQLRNSAQACHLCALIWSSMSLMQQASLLKIDAESQRSMDSDKANASSPARARVIEQHHEDIRRIHLAIEAIDADVPPTDHLERDWQFDRFLPRAQIVPHFGGRRRPRKWMKSVRDYEGLVFDEFGEYAPPIPLIQVDADSSSDLQNISQVYLHDPEDYSGATSTNTGSDEAMAAVRHILSQTKYYYRKTRQSSKFLPGRLLDLRYYKINKMVFIRDKDDILAKHGHRAPKYVALSHCWGSAEFLTLNPGTRRDLEGGIDVFRLTKNFQDAISVTVRCNVGYLWIDSLCIMQGDLRDLAKELPKMCDVYRCAYFTIAAVVAWASDDGFFRDQEPVSRTPCVAGFREESHGMTPWDVSWTDQYLWVALPSKIDGPRERKIEVDLTNWNRRGWCLQERALSSRLVMFGETQIHFEFKVVGPGRRIEEEFSDASSFTSVSSEDVFSQYRFEPLLGLGDAQGLAETAVSGVVPWWRYINSYTQRSLKHVEDKANAIDGLAKSFQESNRNLTVRNWYESFGGDELASLLWYVDQNRGPLRSGATHPTWSWLSVGGVIFNDSLESIDMNRCGFRFIGFSGQDGSPAEGIGDSFVFALSNEIRLHCAGRLARGYCRLEPNQYYQARRTGFGALSRISHTDDESDELDRMRLLDTFHPISSNASMGPAAYTITSTDTFKEVGWLVPDTDESISEYEDIFFLRVVVDHGIDRRQKRIRLVRGIALRFVQHAGSMEYPLYRRIGYFELEAKPAVTEAGFTSRLKALMQEDAIALVGVDATIDGSDLDSHGFFEGSDSFDTEILLN